MKQIVPEKQLVQWLLNYHLSNLNSEGQPVQGLKEMNISEIYEHPILPFEIADEKVRKLFSFFLHSAPLIESHLAENMDEARVERNWAEYIDLFQNDWYDIIAPNCKIENYFAKYSLLPESEINRRTKRFVCKRKDARESDGKCVLRHIRNSIAHGHVYMHSSGNRKYILLEDFNTSGNCSARILLSQSDLKKLKDTITK